MGPDEFDSRLDEAWDQARASGVISESTKQIRDHAAGYVPAAWRVRPPVRLLDAGAGAGVPGLHLAGLLPATQVTMIDSSRRRCEMARTAVTAVGLDDRVAVLHARADELAGDEQWRESFDGVVTRLFGPPAEVAECGLALLAPGGRLVSSVNSETMTWWERAPLVELGAEYEASWSTAAGSYVSVLKRSSCPDRFPRRAAARARRPWPEL